MKGFLYGIGVGLLASTATTAVFQFWRNKKKKKCHVYSNCKNPVNQKSPAKDSSLVYTKNVREEPSYEDSKSSAISSICARHTDATHIIRDSVETILENAKVSEDANDEIDRISAELDNMLSED